ncbi:hypothetical protein CRE_01428 [Caenorhabditis remanei]|uniref:Uncharacterized protein n=1 Tax=Caenorhabditis remanei TaxID=31234 RepID=E3NLD7_CAERE|nr:hypothetical protein CRE_01428 [Caenorhabditis remanei]
MSTDTPIVVSMTSEALWKKCYELENEEIVAKSGRKIFPELKYSIAGLDPDRLYSMTVHFERTDNHMLKWNKKRYIKYKEVPSTVSREDSRGYKSREHLGSFWMKNDVDATDVLITNDKTIENKQRNYVSFENPLYRFHCNPIFKIFLNPNHRYMPVLTVHEGNDVVYVAKLDYTKFIAVCRYHKDAIREIKQNQRSRRNRFRNIIYGNPPPSSTNRPQHVTFNELPRPQPIFQLRPQILNINTIMALLHIPIVPLTNLPNHILLNPVILTLSQMIRVSPMNLKANHILQNFSLFKTLISYQASIDMLVSNFLSLPPPTAILSPAAFLSDNSVPIQISTDSAAVNRDDDVDVDVIN